MAGHRMPKTSPAAFWRPRRRRARWAVQTGVGQQGQNTAASSTGWVCSDPVITGTQQPAQGSRRCRRPPRTQAPTAVGAEGLLVNTTGVRRATPPRPRSWPPGESQLSFFAPTARETGETAGPACSCSRLCQTAAMAARPATSVLVGGGQPGEGQRPAQRADRWLHPADRPAPAAGLASGSPAASAPTGGWLRTAR